MPGGPRTVAWRRLAARLLEVPRRRSGRGVRQIEAPRGQLARVESGGTGQPLLAHGERRRKPPLVSSPARRSEPRAPVRPPGCRAPGNRLGSTGASLLWTNGSAAAAQRNRNSGSAPTSPTTLSKYPNGVVPPSFSARLASSPPAANAAACSRANVLLFKLPRFRPPVFFPRAIKLPVSQSLF